MLLGVGQATAADSIPTLHIEARRLAPLNVSRNGGQLLICNGEPTIFGGHTEAFVPTATAEYYAGGAWHTVPMAYPHDFALCVPLSSGQVLLGGGAEKPLGIGQTHTTEVYDPATHSFGHYDTLLHRPAARCRFRPTRADTRRQPAYSRWL